MRVLLIASNRERHPWPVPPIGACCVASSLEAAGHETELLDLAFSRHPERDVAARIGSFRPDLVGVSVRNIDNVDQQAPQFYLDDVRRDAIDPVRASTTAPVVLGGPAVSIMPGRILEYLGADYAVCGEGETVFPRIADALAVGADPAGIGGVLVRGGGWLPGNPVERVAELDALPPAAIHRWVDWKPYARRYSPYPVQTRRGCALRCSYCVYNSIEGRTWRLRSPRRVVDEIEEILASCGPKVIEFTDSTFNIPRGHAEEICREIIRRRVKCSFSTMGINPGAVTEELAGLMREAGFLEISCTPESGSDRVLASLGKDFRAADIALAARRLASAGIPVVWYFLFGGPGEDESTVRETFDFIEASIRPKDLVFITAGIRILPGSPLHGHAVETGQLAADADLLHPVWYRPAGIAMDRMLSLIEREVITHPNYIDLRENTDSSLTARALKRAYAVLGIREPIWANIMRRDRIRSLSGRNRRRLRKLEERGREGT